MLTSDDDDGGGSYKPRLECMIRASLVDDWGINGAILDQLMGYYRSWRGVRDHNCHLGRSENLHPVQMVVQKAKPKFPVPSV